MTNTPKPAPATPATTPMAQVGVGCGCDEAPECTHSLYWWMGFKEGQKTLLLDQRDEALRLAEEGMSPKAFAELSDAIAMNKTAPQNLPAAAQPQRESEQPEQALRNLARSWLIRYDRDEVELTEDSLIDLMRRAALSRHSEQPALREALEFYADPSTYFAVGFFPDGPCGDFMDDFSDTELGSKPGKRARAALSPQTDSQEQP